jgi:hypothetical protein
MNVSNSFGWRTRLILSLQNSSIILSWEMTFGSCDMLISKKRKAAVRYEFG